MRKFLFIAILLLLISSPTWAIFMSVGTSDAFLREKPNVKSEIVIGAPPYYPLYRLAKAGNWYKVKDWMGSKGWIHDSYVSKAHTAIVRKYRVNFRSGPSTRHKRLGKLFKGYILKVLKRKGYWLKVQLIDPPKKTIGWIHKRLVWPYY